jgi:hypothetical protein
VYCGGVSVQTKELRLEWHASSTAAGATEPLLMANVLMCIDAMNQYAKASLRIQTSLKLNVHILGKDN